MKQTYYVYRGIHKTNYVLQVKMLLQQRFVATFMWCASGLSPSGLIELLLSIQVHIHIHQTAKYVAQKLN